MRKIKNSISILLILIFTSFSLGQEANLGQITKDIKQVVEEFSCGSLNKDSIMRQFGENIKMYCYDPNWVEQNLKEDSGSLFIEHGEYLVCLNYKGDKERRDCGQPPISIIFKNKNGFPMSMLVELFGKWAHYSNEKKMLTKYPIFRFEKEISDKSKIDVIASEIYGPYDKPMQCVCLDFSLTIEKR